METEVHKGPKWNVYITGYANDHEHVQHAVSGVGNYSYDPARILSRKKLSSQAQQINSIQLLAVGRLALLTLQGNGINDSITFSARSVRSLNIDYAPPGIRQSAGNPTIPFDGSSESDRENNEVFAKSTPAFSRTSASAHPAPHLYSNDKTLTIIKASQRSTRKTTDERLQRGLESSLAPREVKSRVNPKRSDLLTSAVASNNGMGQPSTTAIDSKIEQAMDLVKTHLMFAVREELDVLRGKITELEAHIFRLENENAVFKANIPDDILRNLSLDHMN
ncbi:unnamed protein product [Heligmosomoides polygyrus]|uniref:TSC22 domain family protein 1-like n=1 Tax=Heligmosomoides polygyrus TaxID=6339 RepID=A0A3P8CLG9_HELPZ|nr:unnamed protein product [Heligmosomoides polygyrus]